MINIPLNNQIFDTHIKSLTKKLQDKINSIDTSELSKNTLCCLNEIYINAELIIKADVQELKKIIEYFKSNFYCSIGYEENKQTELYLTLSKIFIDDKTGLYKNFTNAEKKEHNSYHLVQALNLKTCPYCNRSYISFVKNDEKKTRPQLDHFYPKAIYPFLACSFYNLIPSCSACNHMKSDDDSYKDEKDGKLVHPYNVKDSDFTFSYTFNNLDILKSIDEKNIKFEDEEKIKITLDKKYEKNNEYFQLETIYQNHKDIVIELILKEINYPRSYINELIKNSFGTEEEIYRFIFSNYLKIDDLHKRPLSKLTRDIVEELGILYKIELATKEEYSTKEQEN
ncbi:hypothetical protein [Aliarcobacter butzleri]|uniref:hypothetical protein n=1 Tax=Aliarcobacter butzleri TaxID=28197 RepID=UPI0021B16E10|nr:hypothetical protein [Aliarcobacter butzleri]MCT7591262.1 hypothetical protein [Aliarcobacter butzleri]